MGDAMEAEMIAEKTKKLEAKGYSEIQIKEHHAQAGKEVADKLVVTKEAQIFKNAQERSKKATAEADQKEHIKVQEIAHKSANKLKSGELEKKKEVAAGEKKIKTMEKAMKADSSAFSEMDGKKFVAMSLAQKAKEEAANELKAKHEGASEKNQKLKLAGEKKAENMQKLNERKLQNLKEQGDTAERAAKIKAEGSTKENAEKLKATVQSADEKATKVESVAVKETNIKRATVDNKRKESRNKFSSKTAAARSAYRSAYISAVNAKKTKEQRSKDH